MTGQLPGKIPQNIPICARMLLTWPVLKRNFHLKKPVAASEEVQFSEVNVYSVTLLHTNIILLMLGLHESDSNLTATESLQIPISSLLEDVLLILW